MPAFSNMPESLSSSANVGKILTASNGNFTDERCSVLLKEQNSSCPQQPITIPLFPAHFPLGRYHYIMVYLLF
jgi:hypothetical protein